MLTPRQKISPVVVFAFATAAIAACSGKTEEQADAGAVAPYTVENVCDRMPALVCEARKSCCTMGHGAFNQAACEATQKGECLKNTAEVTASTMKFDGAKVDTCLAKIKPFMDECRLEFSKLVSYFEVLDECRVFEGTRAVGESCERPTQCAPPAGANAFPSCFGGRCGGGRILSEGDACTLDIREGRICANGLYCRGDGGKYTCAKATSEGGACGSGGNFVELSCGAGYYCARDTNTCTRSKDGASACTSLLECKSAVCNFGTCTTPGPVVPSEMCGI
jgi:hypothetical protein